MYRCHSSHPNRAIIGEHAVIDITDGEIAAPPACRARKPDKNQPVGRSSYMSLKGHFLQRSKRNTLDSPPMVRANFRANTTHAGSLDSVELDGKRNTDQNPLARFTSVCVATPYR